MVFLLTSTYSNYSMSDTSKSQRKREVEGRQDLGKSLTELKPEVLEGFELPSHLLEALLFAQKLTNHEARRRHLQYIGKLMRDIDVEPILAKLALIKQKHDLETQQFQLIEKWRKRLLAEGDVAMRLFLQSYPQADEGILKKQVADAVREQQWGSPKGAGRALFRYIVSLSKPSEA